MAKGRRSDPEPVRGRILNDLRAELDARQRARSIEMGLKLRQELLERRSPDNVVTFPPSSSFAFEAAAA
jgi:hypothetical protein